MGKNTSGSVDPKAVAIANLFDGISTVDEYEGLMKGVFKQVTERILQAELKAHLGYGKHETANTTDNRRNGSSQKTIKSQDGAVTIDVPRDRLGEFEPKFIAKHQRKISSFTDEIIELYGHGLTVRDIQSYLAKRYELDVSTGFISEVTDAILDEMREWQKRRLSECYPIVYLDALVSHSRQDGVAAKRHIYVALGVNMDGEKELLGLWCQPTEGAKGWLAMLSELKNRGVSDILIACVDGLKGFEEAINAVYPETRVQQCIVHQVRHSLRFVPWKERKAVAADLRTIYTAGDIASAESALDEFELKWHAQYPVITPSWRNNWSRLSVFFDYSPEIRKIIYTTNAIESLNASLQKVLKPRKTFNNDEAMIKVIYLAIHRISSRWTMPIHNWKPALNQFAIMFGKERLGLK